MPPPPLPPPLPPPPPEAEKPQEEVKVDKKDCRNLHPPRFKMESENDSFQKGSHFLGSMLNFRGVFCADDVFFFLDETLVGVVAG